MSNHFEVKFYSPSHVIFEGLVSQVVLPGVEGEMGILDKHTPMVAELASGKARLDLQGSGSKNYSISGGYVKVSPESVVVLAESAEAL